MKARLLACLVAPLCSALLLDGATAPPSGAAPASRLPALVESFSKRLSGWDRSGSLRLRRRVDGGGSGVALSGTGSLSRSLPRRPWSLSLDVRLGPRSTVVLRFGTGSGLTLRRGDGSVVVAGAQPFGTPRALTSDPRDGWRHVAVIDGRSPRLAIDGATVKRRVAGGRRLTVELNRGRAELSAVIASSARDRAALLLHRLAALHALTPAGRYPLGQGTDGRLRVSDGWTTGFWPGSLWQAADLTPQSDLFARWALAATLGHLGRERQDTHDLGFIYGSSSVAAYERLCRPRVGAQSGTCRRLKASGLAAARTLLELANSNAAAGMIPTRAKSPCTGCSSLEEADTLVDSMMNVSLLLWGAEITKEPEYRQAAARHAANVARLLVRDDGSTIQSVHVRRSDGTVLFTHTQQGYSDTSTWARGQAWAVYGFAQTATTLRDPALLAVAERTAEYVQRRLPASGVPLYDYDAPAGAPVDTSAGVITAAGLLQLAKACTQLPRTCRQQRAWAPLGRRMLRAALAYVETTPATLGLLGSQVMTRGGSTTWDDDAELIFGLHYALDAVRLSLSEVGVDAPLTPPGRGAPN